MLASLGNRIFRGDIMLKRLAGAIFVPIILMLSGAAFAQDSYWDYADNVVTIKTHHGKYLSVDAQGNVTASKDNAGAKEHFYLKPLGDDKVAIQTWDAKYIASDQNGNLTATEHIVRENETFSFINYQGEWYKFAFRSASGKHISAHENLSVNAQPPWVGSWEVFEVKLRNDYYLKYLDETCLKRLNCALPEFGNRVTLYEDARTCIRDVGKPKRCSFPGPYWVLAPKFLGAACVEHDICYGMANKTKETCDSELRSDLSKRCKGLEDCMRAAQYIMETRADSPSALYRYTQTYKPVREQICSGWSQ